MLEAQADGYPASYYVIPDGAKRGTGIQECLNPTGLRLSRLCHDVLYAHVFSVMPGLTRHPEPYQTENTGFRAKPGMTVAPVGMVLIITTPTLSPE